jgi:putative DNA primase/helicase
MSYSTIDWDREQETIVPMSLFDGMAQFLEQLHRHGITPADPQEIIPDGELHRFNVLGDKPARRNGWYVLRPIWGVAGSFKAGVKFNWRSGESAQLSLSDRRARQRAIRIAQQQREAEQARLAAEAAEHATGLWESLRPANPAHPYLRRKRVRPGPARQLGRALFLPVTDLDGKLQGLQIIDTQGRKCYLRGTRPRGHFVQVTGQMPCRQIVIGEGYATCASVAAYFPGAVVLAALNCGNLLPVAQAVRARFPGADIVIAADDDQLTPDNPGLTAARAAAAAVGARVARPAWPPGISPDATDFNDLANYLRNCHA